MGTARHVEHVPDIKTVRNIKGNAAMSRSKSIQKPEKPGAGKLEMEKSSQFSDLRQNFSIRKEVSNIAQIVG